MTEYSCEICHKLGEVTVKAAMDKDVILLAEDEDEQLICLPCFMAKERRCLHCGEEADLMPDVTCKAQPWLCEECLRLPYRVHMFSCYSDGCMTAEEFSDECNRGVYEDDEIQDLRGD